MGRGLDGPEARAVARARFVQPRRRTFSPTGAVPLAVVSDPGQVSDFRLENRGDQRLPGLHITDHQMRLYMTYRHSKDATVAAEDAGRCYPASIPPQNGTMHRTFRVWPCLRLKLPRS